MGFQWLAYHKVERLESQTLQFQFMDKIARLQRIRQKQAYNFTKIYNTIRNRYFQF